MLLAIGRQKTLPGEAAGDDRPLGRIGDHLPPAEFRALLGVEVLGRNDDVVGKQRRPAPTIFRGVVAQDHGDGPNGVAALLGPQGADERVAFKRLGQRLRVMGIDQRRAELDEIPHLRGGPAPHHIGRVGRGAGLALGGGAENGLAGAGEQ